MKIKLKLKKGDEVIVLAGKDKGKTGKIIKMIPKEMKAIVSEINKVKKNCYKFIKSRRAFSLLELSVILTAASIVVVGSMYLSEYNEVGDKYQETEQKIQSIETAILASIKGKFFILFM